MNISATGFASDDEKQDYSFSDADFATISDLANRRYGLFLQESKKALVYSRLAKRLKALNLDSFQEYCEMLDTPEGHSEQPHLLTALTTNVTHFFREQHHFDLLRDEILPPLILEAKAGRSIRIWSSACSAGQEAYCIAATVLEAFPEAKRYDVKILATDIDISVVEKAKRGVYPVEQRNAIPKEYQSKMIESTSDMKNQFEMRQSLKDLISFGQLNLIDEWPMQRQFDAILCRNAAIYFDKKTQGRLWMRFAEYLTENGYLLIGHSERLSGPAASRFRNVGITSYQILNQNAS